MDKVYRISHTEKKHLSKFDTREVTEVVARNAKVAKQVVQAYFPTHRITSCWLKEK